LTVAYIGVKQNLIYFKENPNQTYYGQLFCNFTKQYHRMGKLSIDFVATYLSEN
jgi:hypothetical protein